ncbi:hypothetical protein PMIN02_005078 [Paraphaeosphaeria minitans]
MHHQLHRGQAAITTASVASIASHCIHRASTVAGASRCIHRRRRVSLHPPPKPRHQPRLKLLFRIEAEAEAAAPIGLELPTPTTTTTTTRHASAGRASSSFDLAALLSGCPWHSADKRPTRNARVPLPLPLPQPDHDHIVSGAPLHGAGSEFSALLLQPSLPPHELPSIAGHPGQATRATHRTSKPG